MNINTFLQETISIGTQVILYVLRNWIYFIAIIATTYAIKHTLKRLHKNYEAKNMQQRDFEVEDTNSESFTDDYITAQYHRRMSFLEKSNRPEDEKLREYLILQTNCMFDPRRETVTFTSKEKALKSVEIQEKLDSLSELEFLTDPYVLNWHNDLHS